MKPDAALLALLADLYAQIVELRHENDVLKAEKRPADT